MPRCFVRKTGLARNVRRDNNRVWWEGLKQTHPHGSVQGAGNLVVLLEPRAATEDLGEPELADGTLHVANLALGRRGSLHPLGGLTADTADHVSMGEGLGSTLLRLDVQRGGDRLGDSRVQGRRAARDDEVGVALVAGAGAAIVGPRAGEGRVGCERGSHGDISVDREVGCAKATMESEGRSWLNGRSRATN